MVIAAACSPTSRSEKRPYPGSAAKYAAGFDIFRSDSVSTIIMYGNPGRTDTTGIFELSGNAKQAHNAVREFIHVPCKRIVTIGSIYTAMVAETGGADHIVAIDNIDYVFSPDVLNAYSKGQIAEVARLPEIDVERIVKLQPDIVFMFAMADGAGNAADRLRRANIPVVVCSDQFERSPLARAEWIRLFAAFNGNVNTGDSIFASVERSYLSLKRKSAQYLEKPKVMAEVKYGDTWYVPGGKSYFATLVADAGGDYIWKSDSTSGSIPLTFEEVFARASAADLWLHQSTYRTKYRLLQDDQRYGAFKAFKSGQLYNNTKITNVKGYSPYWETGMAHPDVVLTDLTRIFHPAGTHARDSLHYYEQLR